VTTNECIASEYRYQELTATEETCN